MIGNKLTTEENKDGLGPLVADTTLSHLIHVETSDQHAGINSCILAGSYACFVT